MLNLKENMPKEVLEQEIEIDEIMEEMEDVEESILNKKKDNGPYIAS